MSPLKGCTVHLKYDIILAFSLTKNMKSDLDFYKTMFYPMVSVLVLFKLYMVFFCYNVIADALFFVIISSRLRYIHA